MCGIAGIVSKKVTLHDLKLMLMMLSHRGPDELGTYVDPEAGIGNARLSILDPVNGTQPVYDPSREVAVVLNGEIFNYIELRSALEKKGYVFRTHTDTEVLLNCYLEYGDSFLADLNGQFSIAIWDRKKRSLLLARDRMGITPLFFYRSKDFFVFSSEIKALLVHKAVPKEINGKALDQIYTFWVPVGKHTILSGIEELPPGKMLLLRDGKVDISSYWEWPFPSRVEDTTAVFEKEKERFVDVLDKAVGLRLRADVEVGAYLSGGIDSSAITALAARRIPASLKSYSVAFDEKDYDERSYQNLVARLCRTKHTMINCSHENIEKSFRDVIWSTETPIFRTAPTPLFLLSQAVNRDAIKVVLSGEGSDEILLGYDLFREHKIRKFWSRQPESAIRPQLFKKLYAYLPHFKNPRYANLTIQFFKSTLLQKSPFYSHTVRWNNNAVNKVYFSEDLRQDLAGYDALREIESILPGDYFKATDIDQAQYLEIMTLLRGYLLASQGDRMTMSHSVEGRYPYLDHEFIAYANALPATFKLSGLKDKHILRESMRDLLPQEICRRPKIAYQAPEIRPFVRLDKTASGLVDRHMSKEAIGGYGLYQWPLVEGLIEKVRNASLERLGTRDNMAFVQILSTQLFCEMFMHEDLRDMAEKRLAANKIPFNVGISKGR